ncbi:DUF664 domain-containing protein [Streptomyces lydicus]|uniref:mycothiol transferase n=1 Tax=Streptomyces lydicus TaxID=47763 RepID=UPI001FCBAF65|nr:DUF664 domain-containing protein [Streptomyces lydicus]
MRGVLVHTIEETARHAGHADILPVSRPTAASAGEHAPRRATPRRPRPTASPRRGGVPSGTGRRPSPCGGPSAGRRGGRRGRR